LPDLESSPQLLSVGGCDKPMPPQTEMLGDRAIGREKALSVAGGLEPLPPALPLPGWLVGVLRTIIQIAMLAMFHPGEDLSPGSTIAL
jgi:hypothetical protein